jgi:hypothetical protein
MPVLVTALTQTVEFNSTKCNVSIKQITKRNTEIQLYNELTGEPVATATAGMKDVLPSEFVYIKDYSENTGILETLVTAGIVSQPLNYVNSGYVSIAVCKLLVETEKD